MSKTTRSEFYYSKKRKEYRKRIKTEDGAVHEVWAPTKELLRAKLKQINKTLDSGGIFNDNTTLLEYAKQWCPTATAGLSYSSKVDYTNAINNHIAPFFKNIKLKDIRPLHIDQFLSTTAHLSKSSSQKIFSTLRNILDSAQENGLVLRNPCINKSCGGISSAPKQPLTVEQQNTLLEALRGTRARVFVALALCAGLRREEILGLSWTDIYLSADTPYLEVTHAVHFEKTKGIRNKLLKSKAARRKIPLPLQLITVLEREKEVQAENNIQSIDDLVISDINGQVCSQTAFRNLWRLVERRKIKPVKFEESKTEKKKVDKHPYCQQTLDFSVTPHQLRHTYITRLCASGMDIKKIQYLAGHSTVQMTLNIYSHVIDNRPDELCGSIYEAFNFGWGASSGSEEKKEAISSK